MNHIIKQANSGLKRFEIGWNGLAQDGAKSFFKVVKENEVLEELDLTYYFIYI